MTGEPIPGGLPVHFLRRQVLVNAGRGFAAVAHGADDEVGAAHQIATREDAGNACHLVGIDHDAAPRVHLDVVGIARGKNRDRIKAEGHKHNIDGHVEFGPRNFARFSAAFGAIAGRLGG